MVVDAFCDDEGLSALYIDGKLVLNDKDLSTHTCHQLLDALYPGMTFNYHSFEPETWSPETQTLWWNGAVWTEDLADVPPEVLLTPVT